MTILVPGDQQSLSDHAQAVRDGFKLPPGRTEREAIEVARKHRKIIFARNIPEDQRIDELVAICTELCCGDEESGKRLATRAIWSLA